MLFSCEDELLILEFLLVVSWVLLGIIGFIWRRTIIFHAVRSFLLVILNIFFKKVDVVGLENVPRYGPVIFVGNHQNQFVDGIVLFTKSPRNISFLVAEKSMRRPIIGLFSQIMNSIPVVRPQDCAHPCSGTITCDVGSTTVHGQNTKFLTDVKVNETITLPKQFADAHEARIVSITSDTELVIDAPFFPLPQPTQGQEEDPSHPTEYHIVESTFSVVPKVNHAQMYESVYHTLHSGHSIGIFPEGGSHDRTQLLPLKPGVAIMALGAMASNPNMARVAIVPCGLNYFQGHRFRSRCVVEYGAPLFVSSELVAKYCGGNKYEAVAELMGQIEHSLRSVTVNVSDYKTLQVLHLCRRLYAPPAMILTTEQIIRLNHRLAVGFEKLKDERKIQSLVQEMNRFNQLLKKHGLRTGHENLSRYELLWKVIYILVLGTLALIPGLLLNAPVGLMARWMSSREAKKAVAHSKVKISGKDVIASYKIIVAIAMMPAWYGTCSFLLWLFSGWPTRYVIAAIISMPLFSYLGIWFTEQGIIMSRSVKPLLLRLLPSYKREQEELFTIRKQLVAQVRTVIEEMGPRLGSEFWNKRVISRDDLVKYSQT